MVSICTRNSLKHSEFVVGFIVSICVLQEPDFRRRRDKHTATPKLESRDAAVHSLSYSIVEGPLPVDNYLSHMSVAARDGGSTIHWSGQFNAKGAPDETAMEVIGGIYDMGLAALKKKFG